MASSSVSWVLGRELNQLVEAFQCFDEWRYDPELVIIVGQERHQTRFFRQEGGGGSSKGCAGYGKGSPSATRHCGKTPHHWPSALFLAHCIQPTPPSGTAPTSPVAGWLTTHARSRPLA